jgi:hypothetical protein
VGPDRTRLIESVGGPMDTMAAVGIWEDPARSVLVRQTIVALPDSWAGKLLGKKVAGQCRDRRIPGTGQRQRVLSELGRTKEGRTERLTYYRTSVDGGTMSSVDALIQVRGHLVFLTLSPSRAVPAPWAFGTIIDEAGARAAGVLGRPTTAGAGSP